MQRHLLIVALVLLSGLLVGLITWWEPVPEAPDRGPMHQTLGLATPPRGGDFRLDSPAGTLNTADLRGQVVLIYFGYTWCPDICPTNLAFVANALKELAPEELERVQVLFVSVDPQRDDSQRLKEYAGYFHPHIRGVTGTPEQIAAAAGLFGAAYRRSDSADSAMGYTVDHSAYTYVIDPQGQLVQALDHATPSARIATVIREALAGG